MVLKPKVIEKIRKLRFEEGLSIRLIAAKLRLSPTTVAKHIKAMENEETVASTKTRSGTRKETKRLDDDLPGEYEMLDRIISELTSSHKRPAIVRMVENHLGDPRKGLDALAEALTLAAINPHEKKLILRNWADHVGIKDISRYIDVEKKEEKRLPEKKVDPFLEQIHEEENKYLQQTLELSKIISKPEEKPAEEKIPYVVDGIMLKLTFQEFLDWKRFESDRETARLEREECRERDERRRKELAEEERRKKEEERREDLKRRGWPV